MAMTEIEEDTNEAIHQLEMEIQSLKSKEGEAAEENGGLLLP